MGYQPVAEHHGKVTKERNDGLFTRGLGSGGGHQRVQTAAKPAEIEPGERCANGETRTPKAVAQQDDQNGGKKAN